MCASKQPAYWRMTRNTIVQLTSPTVSANPHIRMERVYKLGSPWVPLLHFKCYSRIRADGVDASQGGCYGPDVFYKWFLSGGLGAVAFIRLVADMCLVSGRESLPFQCVSQLTLFQRSHQPKFLNRCCPTGHLIARGDCYRFHASWKVLQICQREVFEPRSSAWLTTCYARGTGYVGLDTTMVITGAGASMYGNGKAHVDTDAHHILLVPEVSYDSSASDKSLCSGVNKMQGV